jgi:hypothetical protein
MARVKKPDPTLDSILYSTPEQKLLRLLLSEPTTTFNFRVFASKLKGVRGLGGAEGMHEILGGLQKLGVVEFLDHDRAVRLQDENPIVHLLKILVAVCDLESLREHLEPISSRGILHGVRAEGKAHSESGYDLLVVTDSAEEVKKVVARHPLGKLIHLRTIHADALSGLKSKDPALLAELTRGVTLWGNTAWAGVHL